MTFNPGPAGSNQRPQKIAGYQQASIPQFTPEMMQLFQQLLSGITSGAGAGTNWLSQLASGDESAFGELEAPSYDAFNKLLGTISNRFSNVGARDSSAFQGATADAASRLAQDLGAQRLGIRSQAVQSLLQNSQNLLQQRPNENLLVPQQQKSHWYDSLLGGVGKTLPYLPLLAAGPFGAAAAAGGALASNAVQPGAQGYR